MKRNAIFISLLATLALAGANSPSLAATRNNAELQPRELAEIDLEIRAQAVLMKIPTEIPQDLDPRSIAPAQDVEWQRRLQDYTVRVLNSYCVEKERNACTFAVKEASKSIDFKKLWAGIRKFGIALRTRGRLEGLSVAVAQGIATGAEITVPIIATVLGHPGYIPISMSTPYSVLALGIQASLKKLILRSKLIQLYGSKEHYEKMIEDRAEYRAFIEREPFAFFTFDGKVQAALTSKRPFLRRILEKWGFRTQSLTLERLIEFCKQENEMDGVLKTLSEAEKIPSEIRLMQMLSWAGETRSLDFLVRLKGRFSESFVSVDPGYDNPELRHWYMRVLDVKNAEDLKALFNEVPKQASARQVAVLWQEVMLPTLAGQSFDDIHFMDFRRMVSEFHEIKAAIDLKPELWNQQLRDRVGKYLDDALKHAKSCPEILQADVGLGVDTVFSPSFARALGLGVVNA